MLDPRVAAVRLLFVAVVAAAVAAFVTMDLASTGTTLDVPVIDLPPPTVPEAPLAPEVDPTPLPAPPAPDEQVRSGPSSAAPAVTISPPPVAHPRSNALGDDDRGEGADQVEKGREDEEDRLDEDPEDEDPADEEHEDEDREEDLEDEDPVDDDRIDV